MAGWTVAQGAWANGVGTAPDGGVAPLALTDNSVLQGGAGDDRLDLSEATRASYILGGAGADTIIGGAGNDHLYGHSASQAADDGADSILGGAGSDYIQGNGGDDVLRGGDGSDRLVGGAGDDILFGDIGNDSLQGNKGSDILAGGAGADTLRGGQGDDDLSGGAGDDFLRGDKGHDFMAGGAGVDRFAFAAGDALLSERSGLAANNDTIVDFQAGTDRVDLGFSVASLLIGDPATAFTTQADAGDYASALMAIHMGTREVVALAVGQSTYLFFNQAGGNVADSVIRLLDVAPGQLGLTDFLAG